MQPGHEMRLSVDEFAFPSVLGLWRGAAVEIPGGNNAAIGGQSTQRAGEWRGATAFEAYCQSAKCEKCRSFHDIFKVGVKMQSEKVWKQYQALPSEAQHLVAEFVELLKQREKPDSKRRKKTGKFSDEPFVGMWADRDDMEDSSAWVRNLRKKEWE